MWNIFIKTLNQRSDWEVNERAETSERVASIFDRYHFKDWRRMYRQEFIPEINRSLSKQARLMVALNMGNATNRQRIQAAYNWLPEQIDAILQPLEKRDWDFVQEVWDLVNSFWPEIAEKEVRVTGLAPEKVEALPVQTKFGEYRGGYFPIAYDTRQSPKAFAHAALEAADAMKRGAVGRDSTKRGHTKERSEHEIRRPVRLDFGVIFEHLNQVIHDLAFHEWLVDTNRLLGHEELKNVIVEFYGIETYQAIQDARTAIASGDVAAQTWWDKAADWIRKGTSVAIMGFNFGTALVQPLGLTVSAVRIGPKWVMRGIGKWMGDAFTLESSVRWIHSVSPFMADRNRTINREINEIRNRIAQPTLRRAALGPVEDTYFWLIGRMQMLADVPTWLGAYEKYMAVGVKGRMVDEKEAIALADQEVIDSQGGGQIKDLSAVQRGSPMFRLWLNFYSFFNVLWNNTVEVTKRTDFRDPASIARLASDLFMLYTLPVVLEFYIRQALLGGECDSGRDVRCVGQKLAQNHAGFFLGTLAGFREASGLAQGYYNYTGPPVVKLGKDAYNLAYKGLIEREYDAGFWRDLNRTAGVVLHYPASQIERTVEGFIALQEGKTNKPTAVLTGPPRNERGAQRRTP